MLNTYKLIDAQQMVEEHLRTRNGTNNTPKRAMLNCLAIVVEICEMLNEKPSIFKYWSLQPKEYREKLLEEYVDVVTLFLVVAVENEWCNAIHDPALAFREVTLKMDKEQIAESCLEIIQYISSIGLTNNLQFEGFEKHKYEVNSRHERYFKEAWILVLAIGFKGFAFDEKEIEDAYFRKAQENIKRQASGY